MAKTRNKVLAQKEIDSERQQLFDEVRKTSIIKVAQMIKSADLGRDKDNVVARCAFFLGAGASFQSGIPVAGQMMRFFKEQICCSDCSELTDDVAKDSWIKENVLNKGKGNDYSKLFESYSPKRRNRQHYIESLIQGKKPSFGYAVLANLIERRYVNTVLTTNFDDLVYIACTTFSGIRPVIYAYGVLASEMRLSSPHPKVLKLHGDYLYSALKNTADEINAGDQDPNMAREVRRTTDDFNLIVMGYSGGDESVMKIFEGFSRENELYWCHLKHEVPSMEVLRLIEKKDGSLVAIDGFDEAMHEIRKVVGFDLNELSTSFEERRNFVFEEMAKFEKKYSTPILQTTIDEAKKQSHEKPNETLDWVELLLAGNNALDAKNYQEAEQNYRKVIELNPSVSVAYNNLGYLFSENKNRRDEAEKLLRRAIELDPNSASAYLNLGHLFSENKNRRDEAEELFRRAIELDPNSANAYLNLGHLFLDNKNRRDEAEKLLRRAIELDPNSASAYSNLGYLLGHDKNRRDEAEKLLRRAIELGPNSADPYTTLGYFLRGDKNRRDEAEKLLRQAIELDPNSVNAYIHLGYLLGRDKNRRDEAKESFRRAIELDPNNTYSYIGLALTLLNSSRYDEALPMYEKALSINPEDLSAFIGLANLFKRINDFEKADDYLKQAKKVIDNDDFYNLACINAILGETDSAIENLRKEIELNYYALDNAKYSPSLEFISNDDRFKKIIGEE